MTHPESPASAPPAAPTAPGIALTERAAAKVRALLAEQNAPEGSGLRVKVVGGGCSGMSYSLQIEPKAGAADRVFVSQGISIFLDPKSALFVNGTEVDWQESIMGAAFAFRNPMAKGSCGCGSSFTA